MANFVRAGNRGKQRRESRAGNPAAGPDRSQGEDREETRGGPVPRASDQTRSRPKRPRIDDLENTAVEDQKRT